MLIIKKIDLLENSKAGSLLIKTTGSYIITPVDLGTANQTEEYLD